MPSPALVEAEDYTLIHGNGLRPAGVEAAIKAIRAMPAWQATPGCPTSRAREGSRCHQRDDTIVSTV